MESSLRSTGDWTRMWEGKFCPNHRILWVEKDIRDQPFLQHCQGPTDHVSSATSTWIFSPFKDGDFRWPWTMFPRRCHGMPRRAQHMDTGFLFIPGKGVSIFPCLLTCRRHLCKDLEVPFDAQVKLLSLELNFFIYN